MIEKQIGNIIISVDKRTELLGIIFWISNYHKINKGTKAFEILENKFYIDNIINKFDKYKDDKTIKHFNELIAKHPNFGFDQPFALFLSLDNNYKNNKIDDYVMESLDYDDDVYNFINELEDFSKRINFEKYLEENKNEYQKYIEGYSKAFEMYDINQFMNDYYGYNDNKKFVINLAPFQTYHGYAVEMPDEVHSIISIMASSKKENLFDTKGKEKYVLGLPIHEMNHGYVNPLTEESNLVTNETHIFDTIKEKMKEQAYPNDIFIMNEHIVRAISIRSIEFLFKDKKMYDWNIEEEQKNNFIYINVILNDLKNYESNRDKYKTFDEFYPIIVNHLIEKTIKKH